MAKADHDAELHSELEETSGAELEEPAPDPVAFRLAVGVTALRHTVGGNEISIDEDGVYETADEAEIRALDEHPACERVEAAS
jgi:hypothetical protein